MLQTPRLSTSSISLKPFVLAGLSIASKTSALDSSFHLASLHGRRRRLYSDDAERSHPRTRWTPERTAELFRLRDEGLCTTSIANRFQLSYGIVYNKLNRWSTPVPYRKRKWQAEDVAELLRLRGQGISIKSIAQRLQLPYHSVLGKLRDQPSEGSHRRGQWSPEDIAELFRLRAEGCSIKSIADRMQRSSSSVRGKIYYLRQPVEAHRQTESKYWQEDEIDRLRKIMGRVVERDEIEVLAAELGKSFRSVRTKLGKVRRENNLSKPPRSYGNPKPWTQDDIDRAQHLREEGKPWNQIGAVLGRKPATVRLRLAHAKVTGKPFNPDYYLSPSELQQIQRSYCEGKTIPEIRRLLPRRSPTAIINVIEKSFGRYEEPAFRGEVKMP